MELPRTNPTTRAQTKVAALVAAALVAVLSAGCAEVNEALAATNRRLDEMIAASNARNARLRAEIDAMNAESSGQRVAQGGGSARKKLGNELLEAVALGDIAAAKRLLAAGADVNYSLNCNGCGKMVGDTLVVESVSSGAGTPLGTATIADDSGVVTGGGTMMFKEPQNADSRLEMVRFLLDNGANPNAETVLFGEGDGEDTTSTPLTLAVLWGQDIRIIKLLLDRGANPNAFDGNGKTALMALAEINDGDGDIDGVRAATVDILLSRGAEIEARDKLNGWTPLMWAASHSKAYMVQLLLDKGANVNATGKAKETALALAQKRKNAHTAELRRVRPGEESYAKLLRADINEDEKVIGVLKAATKKKR